MVVGRVIEKHMQSQPSQGTEYVADQLNSQLPAFSESPLFLTVSENLVCVTNCNLVKMQCLRQGAGYWTNGIGVRSWC